MKIAVVPSPRPADWQTIVWQNFKTHGADFSSRGTRGDNVRVSVGPGRTRKPGLVRLTGERCASRRKHTNDVQLGPGLGSPPPGLLPSSHFPVRLGPVKSREQRGVRTVELLPFG